MLRQKAMRSTSSRVFQRGGAQSGHARAAACYNTPPKLESLSPHCLMESPWLTRHISCCAVDAMRRPRRLVRTVLPRHTRERHVASPACFSRPCQNISSARRRLVHPPAPHRRNVSRRPTVGHCRKAFRVLGLSHIRAPALYGCQRPVQADRSVHTSTAQLQA